MKPLARQNRTIAIASDFRVDGAKSPEIPQKEGVLGSEIAARNRRSLATFHRALKSQCIIAVSCLGNREISGVRDGHRNRKSQKSLRFRCAKTIYKLKPYSPKPYSARFRTIEKAKNIRKRYTSWGPIFLETPWNPDN